MLSVNRPIEVAVLYALDGVPSSNWLRTNFPRDSICACTYTYMSNTIT